MRIFLFFLSAFLFIGQASHLQSAHAVGPMNRAVAVVNGAIITSYDLNVVVAPELLRAKLDAKKPADRAAIESLEREVLARMVDEIVVVQEAERLKIVVTDAEIDGEIARFREGSKLDDAGFAKELQRQGFDNERFRQQVRKNLLKSRLLSNMVGRKVVISKDEIAKYYAENQGSIPTAETPGMVRLAVLVYPPNADVKSWASRIQGGKVSFEQAVREISIGPMREQGGDLGNIAAADLAPILLEHLAGLKPGQVSAPFGMDGGVQAQVRLLATEAGGASAATGGTMSADLEALSPQIDRILREPKLQERYVEYMDQLRKRAVVDIRL